MIDTGLPISATENPLGFIYGEGMFGPKVEVRHLEDIRKSLMDPKCSGPEDLYAIAMDIGRSEDLEAMRERNLLFASCNYNYGTMGREPIRSQGHIHAVSPSCGASTCELYEIWEGSAIIYMQEYAEDQPGRCFAIYAKAGDVVIVPPGWAHQTVNADINHLMVFGAWCVRDYGFEYAGVRAHHGLAYYPIVKDGAVDWVSNPSYESQELIRRAPRRYAEFGLEDGLCLYRQFEKDPDRMLFVSRPQTAERQWQHFEP